MSLVTIRGVLAAAVAASGGTFTATVPNNGSDLKSFQAQFPMTTGQLFGAMGHSLNLGANQPLVNIRDFTVTLTNQTTVTITNRTSAAWPAGTPFVLQLDMKGARWYQDNNPVFARKTMAMVAAGLFLAAHGCPDYRSSTCCHAYDSKL